MFTGINKADIMRLSTSHGERAVLAASGRAAPAAEPAADGSEAIMKFKAAGDVVRLATTKKW